MLSLAIFIVFFPSALIYADTTISSSITTNTEWTTAGGVYIISGAIGINSGVTLTIDPGVIVKFNSSSNSLTVNGTLNAIGTATSSIYFTSKKDDSVGGDTNGDGSATLPAKGDWKHIQINSGGTANFAYVNVQYGGANVCCGQSSSDIYNSGGVLTIASSTAANATLYAIYPLSGTTTITAVTMASSTYGTTVSGGPSDYNNVTINDSVFSGNSSYAMMMNNIANFSHSNNVAVDNGYNGFAVGTNFIMDETLPAERAPYIFGVLSIPSGKTLTIDPGAVIKFLNTSAQIAVSGTLHAVGSVSDEIFFTSLKDDLEGGDTNNDASSTSPAAGDWKQIQINSGGAADIEHALIRYGGANVCCSQSLADLYNNGGTITVASSTIVYASTYGISQSSGTATVTSSDLAFNGYGFYLTGGTASISATSTIHDNSSYGAYNSTGATSSLSATGNYWGDSSGPHNTLYNPTGSGNSISNFITFSPWIGQNTLHYVENNCPSSTCGSVRDGEILLESDTSYTYELGLATSTWNAAKSMIQTATDTSTLLLSDGYYSDVVWKGGYATGTPGVITLNTYYLDPDTTSQRQNTIEHELGHALGLDHSYTGNVMFFAQSSQTTLGSQDTNDLDYLWP